MEWKIRRAEPSDAAAVRIVADAAWRDTYNGLLKLETIDAFIAASYSIDNVNWRIANDHVLVAEGERGISAFADAVKHDDRVELAAIYALPVVRGQGAGTLLLNSLVADFPGLPMVADVLLGNRKGEVFYEHRGFVPKERLEGDLYGEQVVERRWWKSP